MDSSRTTASNESTMDAKLIGVQENWYRPIRVVFPIVLERTGVSKPTQCLFMASDGSLKWVAVNAGVFPGMWSLRNTDHLVFPPFPTGAWNVGQIRRLEDGEVAITKTLETAIPEVIKNVWHPTKIEFAEFEIVGQSKGNGRLWNAKHPLFNDKLVFIKIDPWLNDFSMEAMENETRAYQLIDGHGIAPQFLGHVTYQGVVIGFILEWIEGAYTSEKADEFDRIKAVKKLHALGITHGSAHHENFLKIGKDILIIDFENSKFGDQATKKRKERDFQRISNFDMDMWDVGSVDDDDDDDPKPSDICKFFDNFSDDEICWSDDSDEEWRIKCLTRDTYFDDSDWETASDSEDDGDSKEDDSDSDSRKSAPRDLVEKGDMH